MFFGSTRPESGSAVVSPVDADMVEPLLQLDFETAEDLIGR